MAHNRRGGHPAAHEETMKSRRGGHPITQGAQPAISTGEGRRTIRLPAFDYSSPGAYFVTSCTHNREPTFDDDELRALVEEAWRWLPERFSAVEPDEFVIMPDHVHFIVRLLDGAERRGGRTGVGGQMAAPTLANIVGAFKTVVARSVNEHRGTTGRPVWQRNYYEHIVRDEDELERIREYIRNNPLADHNHVTGEFSEAWEANP